MRVPQVNERVKEAPAQALRAVFASIGQLLLVTDRLRNRNPEDTPAAETPESTDAAATPETAAAPDEAPAAEAEAPAAKATTAAPAAEAPAAEATATEAEAPATEATVAEPAAASAPAEPVSELPLPNYDELTVPSLRARMRNLTVDQLNSLISYEQSHANREDVIAMFQRRIAKLNEA